MYPRNSFSGGYSSLTQLSADKKVGKLFALAIVAETPVGRIILRQQCDPAFDLNRKAPARQFKQDKVDNSESDATDEEGETLNPQEVEVAPQKPTRFSKLDFDVEDSDHVNFVSKQIGLHGLDYLSPFLDQMGDHHSSKARSIV
jgi:hypothetical protein